MFPLYVMLFACCFVRLECAPHPLLSISDTTLKRCPYGWVRYGTEKCIRLFDDPVAQDEAELRCNNLGATLNSIHSTHELEFVKSYLLKTITREKLTHTWVGLKRVESKWFWFDLSSFDYADWYPTNPHLGPELSCGSLATGLWNLRDTPPHYGKINNAWGCEAQIPYICQIYFADY